MKTEFPVGDLIRNEHRELRRLFTELENRQGRPLAARSQHGHAEADRLVEQLVRSTQYASSFGLRPALHCGPAAPTADVSGNQKLISAWWTVPQRAVTAVPS